MALIICQECGAEISDKADICIKCGCPIEKSSKNEKKPNVKKIVTLVVAIIVVVSIGVGILIKVSDPDSKGYYNGFKWGMTYEQVKSELGDILSSDDDKKLVACHSADYEGKTGVTSICSYDCSNDALSRITIILSITEDSSYTDELLINEYIERFDKLYGEHEKESSYYTWSAKKSVIEVSHITDGIIIIEYKDKSKA